MKKQLLAPNGKPSNLNPIQYKLVRTAAFKKWFGNWENDPKNASKAVDDNGEPMVVYHGTKSKFTEFDINSISANTGNFGHYGYGFYFSNDFREAKVYGDIVLSCFVNFRNPFTWTKENVILLKENGVYWIDDLEDVAFDKLDLIEKVSKVSLPASELLQLISENGYEDGWRMWLKKYNPNDYSIDFNDVASLLDDSQIEYNKEYLDSIGVTDVKTIKDFPYEQSLHWITELGERSKEVTDIIYSLGFDSIVYGSEYIAFEPNQIKLADGTNTTFDGNNSDIRFEVGGEIYFKSTKSISIKIKKDLYGIQYRKGERGDTDKNVWFAEVISKNGEDTEGRLCLAPDMSAIIYGFSLKEVESLIWEAYIDSELYLIIGDDYGNDKEIIHIRVSDEYKRFEQGGEMKYTTPDYLVMFLGK